MRPHPGPRAFLVRRLDRSATTGLLLTLAFAITLVGTLLLGVLAVLVRRVAALQHVDNFVAAWGYDHRGRCTSTSALNAVTNLGNIRIVVGLALVLVIVELYRHRNRWPLLFLTTVLAGHGDLDARRQRSGRTPSTDAEPGGRVARPLVPERSLCYRCCVYAAAALVIGRGLRGRVQHVIAAIAVATGCGSRREPRATRSSLAV